MKNRFKLLLLLLIIALSITGCDISSYIPEDFIPGDITSGQLPGDDEKDEEKNQDDKDTDAVPIISLDAIPEFDGENPYTVINGNLPFFEESELTAESYEYYSELDALGRCGVTVACIGKDTMPTEERGSIGTVKPSGWHTVKYDIVSGKYLYNRCHLIGYQLTAENANEKNLITGTRFMNVDGMLPFEDMVADYIKETDNHVLYRVTPIFKGTNLVAQGVLIEAVSIEDGGDGIQLCVYVYNNQPGIVIDYSTGESRLDDGTATQPPSSDENKDSETEKSDTGTYILNTDTMKFHKESCRYASSMKPENKDVYEGAREDLIEAGYDNCGVCKP